MFRVLSLINKAALSAFFTYSGMAFYNIIEVLLHFFEATMIQSGSLEIL